MKITVLAGNSHLSRGRSLQRLRSSLGLTFLNLNLSTKKNASCEIFLYNRVNWLFFNFIPHNFFLNPEALIICLQSFHFDAKNCCLYISPFVCYETKLEFVPVMKQFESCKNIISWPRYRNFSESCIICVTLSASEFLKR